MKPKSIANPCLTRHEFRQRLEQQADVGRLEDLLKPVVADSTSPHFGLRRLVRTVHEACYGAFNFHDMDWNSGYRSQEKELTEARPRFIRSLKHARDTLWALPLQSEELLTATEQLLRERYDSEFRFPLPAYDYVNELFGALIDAFETPAGELALSDDYLAATRQHGCLDYGRKVQGAKVRSTRAMLAFNLVLVLRSASQGACRSGGSMPKDGRPHAAIVAKLVRATLGEEADTPITEVWVTDSVVGIASNPLVTVVPWPIGLTDPFS